MIAEERRNKPRLSKYVRRHHPIEKIIGDKDARPMTRRRSTSGTCLASEVEQKIVKEALDNEDWIIVMNEEIDQIEKNKTQSLVPRLEDKNVIGTKWVFKNKLDENGEVTENKARLVCKGYAQEEGNDVILEEEVYIEQPKGFVDPKNNDKVCKFHKALYGLKHMKDCTITSKE